MVFIRPNQMNKPKYNIGDKVWKIYDSKAKEFTVYGVGTFKGKFEYQLSDDGSFLYEEKELFTSKEEIIKQL